MNPTKMLKLKKEWDAFNARHPKFVRYLGVVKAGGYLADGSVVDVTITNPDGKALHANVRMTKEDIELINTLF